MKSLSAHTPFGQTLATLLVLPLILSGCAVLDSPAGRISLLVLSPLLFVGLLLWAIRMQRRGRLPDREDKRGYPDYDDRD